MQVLTDDDPNKKPEDYNPIELQKLARYSVDSFVDPNYRSWFVHCKTARSSRDSLINNQINLKKFEAWLS